MIEEIVGWLQALLSVIGALLGDPVGLISTVASGLGLAIVFRCLCRRKGDPSPTVNAASDREHEQH